MLECLGRTLHLSLLLMCTLGAAGKDGSSSCTPATYVGDPEGVLFAVVDIWGVQDTSLSKKKKKSGVVQFTVESIFPYSNSTFSFLGT